MKNRPLANRALLACLVLGISLSVHGLASAQAAKQEQKSYTLVQLLTAIEQSNRAIEASRRLVGVAQAEVKRADVGQNPSISYGAFNSVAKRFRYSELDQTLRIERTYERGDKRALRVAAAQEFVEASQADTLEVIRQQRLLGASAYVDLMFAQRALLLSEQNEANIKRLFEGAQLRLKAGDIATVDVSRLTVELARAANEVRAAQTELQQIQAKLAAMLVIETAPIVASESLPDASTIAENAALYSYDNNATALERATQQRSDLQAAKAKFKAFEKALALAKSQQVRDITLGAQTEKGPGYGGRIFGVSASIPLFTQNDYSSEVVKALADLNVAAGDLDKVKAQIKTEADLAFTQLLGSKDRLQRLLDVTLPETRKATQAIEYAYARGAASLTDLFDTRRQFNAVQVEAATAQADFARALDLYKATVLGQ